MQKEQTPAAPWFAITLGLAGLLTGFGAYIAQAGTYVSAASSVCPACQNGNCAQKATHCNGEDCSGGGCSECAKQAVS